MRKTLKELATRDNQPLLFEEFIESGSLTDCRNDRYSLSDTWLTRTTKRKLNIFSTEHTIGGRRSCLGLALCKALRQWIRRCLLKTFAGKEFSHE